MHSGLDERELLLGSVGVFTRGSECRAVLCQEGDRQQLCPVLRSSHPHRRPGDSVYMEESATGTA